MIFIISNSERIKSPFFFFIGKQANKDLRLKSHSSHQQVPSPALHVPIFSYTEFAVFFKVFANGFFYF
jgi:hypothetical protein